MTRWILAAEADKIQDFVFRSTHLREVVGGSQLLLRFCDEEALDLLKQHRGSTKDLPVHDGGSFTVLFDSKKEAQQFGKALAQRYRRFTNATLTVAEPVEWDDGTAFDVANDASREALSLAKRDGRRSASTIHLPHAAFCASCGVALADRHIVMPGTDEAPSYLCQVCHAKAEARDRDDKDESGGFLFKFKEAVGATSSQQLPKDADELGDWDRRNYVAYMVADGNSMGEVFGECPDVDTLGKLSEHLPDVLRRSLAEPTQMLMKQVPDWLRREDRTWLIPALPLILGGDDVFMLLPAPYAVDFTHRFCKAYEKNMKAALKEVGLWKRLQDKHEKNFVPTIAAAVVVCKSKYPHTLAYHHAHELLGQAKQLSKRVAWDRKQLLSAVHFDVVLGSQIPGARANGEGEFRAALSPYWVADSPPPERTGLRLGDLIDQRYALRKLPARRLAQLRAVFAHPPANYDAIGAWQARLWQVLARVGRGEAQLEALEKSLRLLGTDNHGYWYELERVDPKCVPDHEKKWKFGHGLPDLLEMWDFSYDLERPRSDYVEQEEA